MNFADSEVVASILQGAGYATTMNEAEADVIMINTCSITGQSGTICSNSLKGIQDKKEVAT